MRCWTGAICGIGLLLSSVAVAGVRQAVVNDQVHIDLGNEDRYAATGAVLGTVPAGSYLASGTLVATDWVLTAAHVVGGTDLLGGGVTNLRFILGPNASGTPVYADSWVPHPGWATSGGSTGGGFDIGLIHLNTPITDVPFASRFFGTAKGMIGTHVGYGLSGTGTTGYVANTSGTKRAGDNVLDALGGEQVTRGNGTHFTLTGYSSNILFDDLDNPANSNDSLMGSSSPQPKEYITAPGDSGGGLYVESGGTRLAGVHSIGVSYDGSTNSDYGDLSGSTRLDGLWTKSGKTFTFNDWISSYITVPGDADSDFDVDLSDLGMLATHYGISSGGHWNFGDFDLDGDVDLADLGSLATHYGAGAAQAFADFQVLTGTAVPEPTAFSVLAFTACAALIRRRRRRCCC